MPGLVGGFGKENQIIIAILILTFVRIESLFYASYIISNNSSSAGKELEAPMARDKLFYNNATNNWQENVIINSKLGGYLAGLIEGDGTFAVHDKKSTAKKYNPMILIVFKKSDFPLANFLKEITNCGTVMVKQDRGYVL